MNICSSRRCHLCRSTLIAVGGWIRHAFDGMMVFPSARRLRFVTAQDLVHVRVIFASLGVGMSSVCNSERMKTTMNDGSWYNIGTLQGRILLKLVVNIRICLSCHFSLLICMHVIEVHASERRCRRRGSASCCCLNQLNIASVKLRLPGKSTNIA